MGESLAPREGLDTTAAQIRTAYARLWGEPPSSRIPVGARRDVRPRAAGRKTLTHTHSGEYHCVTRRVRLQ